MVEATAAARRRPPVSPRARTGDYGTLDSNGDVLQRDTVFSGFDVCEILGLIHSCD